MTELTITNFDLNQIAASGQCFRMVSHGNAPKIYETVSRGRHLTVSQDQDRVTFGCPCQDMPFWKQYFDLETDYAAMIDSIDIKDSYLLAAAEYGSGIRILRQDPWEMIITFIISQQKTIPAIRQLVEALSQNYGTPLEWAGISPGAKTGRRYAFPTPQQLNRASLEDLAELKLGYRAKYIKKTCEDACTGLLDLEYLETLDYGASMEYLQGFYGIGEKVANCICLFGLHHIDAFPVDTWIRKILIREYGARCRGIKKIPQSKVCETLVQKYFSQYKGYAGVMQQYLFYFERSLPD